MKTRSTIRPWLMALALAAAGVSLAASAAPPSASDPPKQQQAPAQSGMMGHGMMGSDMGDMMHSCQSMMGSAGMMSGMGMPKLPSGNEKLEAQMHAEMMQKMSEIAARYAERIK